MQRVIKSILLVTALVSCGTDKDSRYQDISHLERPPTLPANPSASPSESYAVDDSRIEKRQSDTGLGNKVYLTNATPLQLRIRMPIDKAWYALAQALKQSSDTLKITDYDRDKKIYYVSSGDESSAGFFSFLSDNKKINYVLSMKGAGGETAVMANLAAEQSGAADNQDSNNETEKLLRMLYGILHDDLKLEYNGS